ncbi:hypothetical protein LUZ63_008401 [Rhynchospora breviuscula]|uniref:Aminotransferase-like plant mobile domain-containing protein n=1 Tax=Rhynchospora breviuscula TaxID=2022672 RepID=A0A9Q0CUQ3_9POAL|nr:hypothetical protein LUZ63_008401 [Rhynchospora breviuscula]
MPPRRRVGDIGESSVRRSTRRRSGAADIEATPPDSACTADAGASTSTGDAGASTSVPSIPVDDSRLLHLNEEQFRGTGDWKTIVHKATMIRTAEVDERLTTLGLIHFVQVGHMPLDHSLLQDLAMFWRPETHTFFFPHVGEMTVTLQDVAFLYGLPTEGRPVTGRTDLNDLQLLMDLALPMDTSVEIAENCFREKTRK